MTTERFQYDNYYRNRGYQDRLDNFPPALPRHFSYLAGYFVDWALDGGKTYVEVYQELDLCAIIARPETVPPRSPLTNRYPL